MPVLDSVTAIFDFFVPFMLFIIAGLLIIRN